MPRPASWQLSLHFIITQSFSLVHFFCFSDCLGRRWLQNYHNNNEIVTQKPPFTLDIYWTAHNGSEQELVNAGEATGGNTGGTASSSSDNEKYSFVPDGTKDSDVSTAKDPTYWWRKNSGNFCFPFTCLFA